MFKMNEKQKALFGRLTTLQQEISLNSFSGMNDIDSYKNSKGKAVKENVMAATVSEILSNPKVVDFIDSMKEAVISDAILTRKEMLETLTKLSKLTDEQLTISVGAMAELKGGYDVKMKAMDMISKLEGWDSATKYDHTSSDGSMTPKGRNLDDFYADDD